MTCERAEMCVKDGCVEEEGGALWIVAAAGWLLGWFPWQLVIKKKRKRKRVQAPSPVLMLRTKE